MSLRDLNAKIPGAPNFQYKEFIKSDTAMRKGISNIPTEEHWQYLEALAVNILQPVREKFGRLRITSGYRSVELCEAVGSNKNSNHARGMAADFEPISSNVRLFNILEYIHNELNFRELIAEYFDSGWIHCAYSEGRNVKTLKLKDNNHHYKRVSLDYIRGLYG